jgi:CBS domain-containing protein
LVGVLTRNDLAAALGRQCPESRVAEAMQQEFVTTHPREMLQTAFARLQDGHCRTLPVVENGRLVGLLTTDNLAEVLMFQEALREARRPAMFSASSRTDQAWTRSGDLTGKTWGR